MKTDFPLGHRVSLSDKQFAGPSDAHIIAVVEHYENEHPAAIVKLLLCDGLFATEIEKVGEDDSRAITVNFALKDRADGELCMFAQAMHWIADQIVPADKLEAFRHMMDEMNEMKDG